MTAQALATLILAALLVGHPARAQATSPDSARSIMAQLASDRVAVRAVAFRQLTQPTRLTQPPDVQRALVELLETENQLIAVTLNAGGTPLGDGFSEYYSDVLAHVLANGDLTDDRTVRAVALGAYNPDAPLVQRLATAAGQRVLPVAFEMLAGPAGSLRLNGLALLGSVYRDRAVHDLDQANEQRIKRLIAAAAVDPWVSLRIDAVSLLAQVGVPADLPLLSQIGETDPYTQVHESLGPVYPVREAARAAMRAIEQRHRE